MACTVKMDQNYSVQNCSDQFLSGCVYFSLSDLWRYLLWWFLRHALTFQTLATVHKPTKAEKWGMTSVIFITVGQERGRPSSLCHFFVAATATEWSISGCWRGAASTASGKRPSAPSTVWWTSTERTASPWTKWCASETPPCHPSCMCSRGATLIPTLIKTAPRNPSTQPTCTLTMRGSLAVSLILG